jgi:hypothetical protein
VTLANAADFPSPRKANEGGEKTVAEVERIKRNRMKEKMRGNAKTEEKAPRYYDVLPNQFEDEDGNVPEYANPALDRIRALNRNLIAQIWTGHRKLPAGILDKEFGQKNELREKAATYTHGRKRTEAEIREHEERYKQQTFDISEIYKKAKIKKVAARPETLLGHLNPNKNRNAEFRLMDKRHQTATEFYTLTLNVIDIIVTLLEHDLVACEDMTQDAYLQIWKKAHEPTSAATAATAGLRGAASSVSIGKRKPLKKASSTLDPEQPGPRSTYIGNDKIRYLATVKYPTFKVKRYNERIV